MKKFIWAIVCIVVASCGSDHPGEKKTSLASHFLSISDSEDKGIKDVISSFGGECEYGFSKSVSVNEEQQNTFWLSVRKSQSIDDLPIDAEVFASGIALTFYRNLKEEKSKYSHVKVKVVKSGSSSEKSFSVKLLDSVLSRFNVVKSAINFIDKEDYKSFSNSVYLDERFIEDLDAQKKATFLDTVKAIRNSTGPLKEIISIGFNEISLPDGSEFLYYSIFVLFEKRNYPISLVVNRDTTDQRVHFFNYNF
ncbi:MAG: hypothetical protein EOP04_19375 [Proteobacteria bacterium]|nr:MAG: hypothetical protein EOP04_19375 [Pseudomonadota bacterium]